MRPSAPFPRPPARPPASAPRSEPMPLLEDEVLRPEGLFSAAPPMAPLRPAPRAADSRPAAFQSIPERAVASANATNANANASNGAAALPPDGLQRPSVSDPRVAAPAEAMPMPAAAAPANPPAAPATNTVRSMASKLDAYVRSRQDLRPAPDSPRPAAAAPTRPRPHVEVEALDTQPPPLRRKHASPTIPVRLRGEVPVEVFEHDELSRPAPGTPGATAPQADSVGTGLGREARQMAARASNPSGPHRVDPGEPGRPRGFRLQDFDLLPQQPKRR